MILPVLEQKSTLEELAIQERDEKILHLICKVAILEDEIAWKDNYIKEYTKLQDARHEALEQAYYKALFKN